jgi:hypothetical protein
MIPLRYPLRPMAERDCDRGGPYPPLSLFPARFGLVRRPGSPLVAQAAPLPPLSRRSEGAPEARARVSSTATSSAQTRRTPESRPANGSSKARRSTPVKRAAEAERDYRRKGP